MSAEKLKRIRIVGDGSPAGTRVFDSSGKDITAELRVRKLTITHEARGIPVAVLECLMPEVDITCLDDCAIKHVNPLHPTPDETLKK